MSRIKHARPSPAILIAVIALVAALAGSAIADVATTSLDKNDTKKVKKLAKKQAKKQDKKQDQRNFPVDSSQIGRGAVSSAKIGDGAVTSAKIADAAKGVPGYALVAANGFVNNDEQRGVVGTNHPETGVYCFDLSFEAQVAVASPEIGPTRIAQSFAPGAGAACPAGFKDASVEIVDLADTPQDKGFYVLFN
jgi:CBS domain containing-hemolysin-like protein